MIVHIANTDFLCDKLFETLKMDRVYSLSIGSTFIFLTLLLASCTPPSAEPELEELIKTSQPTVSGRSDVNLTTSTIRYDLSGECDSLSKAIEYSLDLNTWNELAGGCQNSKFTILQVYVPGVTKVYVRARTKFGQTANLTATIRLLLPPTSPSSQLVTAGRSVNEGPFSLNFTMGSSIDGQALDSPNFLLDTNTIGIVYGQ